MPRILMMAFSLACQLCSVSLSWKQGSIELKVRSRSSLEAMYTGWTFSSDAAAAAAMDVPGRVGGSDDDGERTLSSDGSVKNSEEGVDAVWGEVELRTSLRIESASGLRIFCFSSSFLRSLFAPGGAFEKRDTSAALEPSRQNGSASASSSTNGVRNVLTGNLLLYERRSGKTLQTCENEGKSDQLAILRCLLP